MKYAIVFLLATSAWSQKLDLSSLDKLSKNAKESSIVDLDPEKLKMAAGFLSGDDNSRGRTTGEALRNVKGVFVRSFEFSKKGAYAQSDLEDVRKQLRGPGWSKMIDVKGEDETAEIYFYKQGADSGMAVVASEAQEVAVVNIIGSVDLASLASLGASFGFPVGDQKQPAKNAPKTAKEEDDDEDNQ